MIICRQSSLLSIFSSFRVLSLVCITLTLYGGGCVFIVLIAQLLGSILSTWAGLHLTLCLWMVIVAAFLTPLTWMGTPKDFWYTLSFIDERMIDQSLTLFIYPPRRPIAVGALLTTVAACAMIVVQSIIDGAALEGPVDFPPPTLQGTFKAFGSIMFAFAGASTFPTIQADMKKRERFNIAAIVACFSERF